MKIDAESGERCLGAEDFQEPPGEEAWTGLPEKEPTLPAS